MYILYQYYPDTMAIFNTDIMIQFQQFYTDGARIEAAFRKYFHRAESEQTNDSYEIMVCHANVIRYFVCRSVNLEPYTGTCRKNEEVSFNINFSYMLLLYLSKSSIFLYPAKQSQEVYWSHPVGWCFSLMIGRSVSKYWSEQLPVIFRFP